MPSELGRLIRSRRQEKGIGLREFAKLIGKSPAFVTNLEMDDQPPSATEETLREIALKLELDAYDVITLAGKTPQEIAPKSGFEAALYRRIKALSEEEKRDLFNSLPDPRHTDP